MGISALVMEVLCALKCPGVRWTLTTATCPFSPQTSCGEPDGKRAIQGTLAGDRQASNQAPDPGLAFLYTMGPQEAVDSFQAVAIAPTVCILSAHCHQHQPKRVAGKPVSLFYSHGFKKIY